MFHNEIADNHLKVILQNYLSEFYSSDPVLKGLRLCGRNSLHIPMTKPGTTIISDEEQSYTFGTNLCHSSWACPRCSAAVMAKYGENLACLIDYLAKEHTFAYMLTLTMPHSIKTPIDLQIKIITKAWRAFQKTNINNKKEQNINIQLRRKLQVKHIVRCYEVTYGKNGYHSHIHCLYFTKYNAQPLKDNEDKLTDYWLHKVKLAYLTYLPEFARNIRQEIQATGSYKYSTANSFDRFTFTLQTTLTDIKKALDYQKIPTDFIDDDFKNQIESENIRQKCLAFARIEAELLFNTYKNRPITGHRSCYVSVDKNNKPKKVSSSHYLTDSWTGDKETTGHEHKEAHGDNDTMYSLLIKGEQEEKERLKQRKLDKITLGDQAPHPRNKYFELYIAYAKATRGRRRFQMSKDDQKLVQLYKTTNAYEQLIKKKKSGKAEKIVVCWFTSEQWSRICYLEVTHHTDIRTKILSLARYLDWRLIHDFMLEYDIHLRPNEECPHLQFLDNRYIDTTEEYQKAIIGA